MIFHIDIRVRILGHMVIGLKQVRVTSNLVPSPKRKIIFFHFWHVREKALFGHISHMSTN